MDIKKNNNTKRYGDFVVPTKPKVNSTSVVNKPMEKISNSKPKKQYKYFKKFKLWIRYIWQPLTLMLLVLLVITAMLGYNIDSFNNGVSNNEQNFINSTNSGQKLLNDPTYLITKIPTYLMFKLEVSNIAYYRGISAIIGAVVIISSILLIRRWFATRVAILAGWLMLSSAWFLHVSRSASPEINYLLLLPLISISAWSYVSNKRKTAFLLLVIFSCLCLYTPGFVWFIVGGIIWQRKTILKEFTMLGIISKSLLVIALLILISPIIYSVYNNYNIIFSFIGLPKDIPRLDIIISNIINIPINVFYKNEYNPALWLGTLPLLDVFSSTMLFLGIYSLKHHILLFRTQLLISSSIILISLVVIGDTIPITALFPIIYILIASGIAFLLQQWFVVFPRNPIARIIATTLISFVILMVSYFHISHYFIAWPQNRDTKGAFRHSLLK